MKNTKKLFIIFHGRFPTEKAASLFVAKSVEAFADEGMKVKLLVPRRIGRVYTDPYEYYGVKRNFEVIFLPVIDIGTRNIFQGLRFFLSFITFSLSSYFYIFFHAKRKDIIYSNETLPLFLASYLFPLTFYEIHDFPESKLSFFRFFLKRIKWILIHNQWKVEKAREVFGLQGDNILYQPNAVDIKAFDLSLTKEQARNELKKILPELSFPPEKKMIIYTGHLYQWKGVDILAKAMNYFSQSSEEVNCYFIGGTPEDIATFSSKYSKNPNIIIVGHRSHKEIPIWQKAGDILVLPNTAKEKISLYYTSPMKLFEYMASRRPIVASDIPSIREIVDDHQVVFVAPDDPQDLARGIRKTLENENGDEIAGKVNKSFEKVVDFSWHKRAKNIILFINK
jgi:glycosyltransferase involved in cell wall biosynthesis